MLDTLDLPAMIVAPDPRIADLEKRAEASMPNRAGLPENKLWAHEHRPSLDTAEYCYFARLIDIKSLCANLWEDFIFLFDRDFFGLDDNRSEFAAKNSVSYDNYRGFFKMFPDGGLQFVHIGDAWGTSPGCAWGFFAHKYATEEGNTEEESSIHRNNRNIFLELLTAPELDSYRQMSGRWLAHHYNMQSPATISPATATVNQMLDEYFMLSPEVRAYRLDKHQALERMAVQYLRESPRYKAGIAKGPLTMGPL